MQPKNNLPNIDIFSDVPRPKQGVLIECDDCDLNSKHVSVLLGSKESSITLEVAYTPSSSSARNLKQAKTCEHVRTYYIGRGEESTIPSIVSGSGKEDVVYYLLNVPAQVSGGRRKLDDYDDFDDDVDDGYGGDGDNNGYSNGDVDFSTMMHKIQYTQLVLWTTLTLVGCSFYCVYLMVVMPMYTDTLLYGDFMNVMGGMDGGIKR